MPDIDGNVRKVDSFRAVRRLNSISPTVDQKIAITWNKVTMTWKCSESRSKLICIVALCTSTCVFLIGTAITIYCAVAQPPQHLLLVGLALLCSGLLATVASGLLLRFATSRVQVCPQDLQAIGARVDLARSALTLTAASLDARCDCLAKHNTLEKVTNWVQSVCEQDKVVSIGLSPSPAPVIVFTPSCNSQTLSVSMPVEGIPS